MSSCGLEQNMVGIDAVALAVMLSKCGEQQHHQQTAES